MQGTTIKKMRLKLLTRTIYLQTKSKETLSEVKIQFEISIKICLPLRMGGFIVKEV